ncbi:transposase [Paraburkholderia sp. GAS348]|jgi:hypothetical protein
MVRWLMSDAQWTMIDHLLSGKASDPGRTAADNRLFVEAVLWISRTGAPTFSRRPKKRGRRHLGGHGED